MRLRTPLLLLVGALAGATVPSTAFAAVPKRAPNTAYSCGSESAKLWVEKKHVAAKNQCDHWFIIIRTAENGDEFYASVAPGAHFNRRTAELGWPAGGTRGYFAQGWECGRVFLKNSKGKSVSYC